MNKLLAGSIGVTVAIIVLAGVLVPVTQDSLKVLGDPIEESNVVYNAMYVKLAPGDEYEIASSGITLNGESIPNAQSRPLIYSDNISGELLSGDTLAYFNFSDNSALSVSTAQTASIKVLANTIEVTQGETTKTFEYTWAYGLALDGDYTLCIPASDLPEVTDPNSIIGGGYRFGTTNYFYMYYNGVLTSGTSVCSAYTDLELVDGTTDIYSADVTLTIGSDSFSPGYLIVPSTVMGHKDGGASYSLVQILPLMVIVAILMYAISFAIPKRD